MIRLVSFVDSLESIAPVIRASYEETEDQNIKLGLDIKTLAKLEQEGELITVIYQEHDRPVEGLLIFNLFHNIHHASLVFAESRIFYIDHIHRGTNLLKNMIAKVEIVAKGLGVDKIHIGSRKRSAYFNRLGYEEDQVTYTKFIGESS